MKKFIAGLCAAGFALALVGCGDKAPPVKKPVDPAKTPVTTPAKPDAPKVPEVKACEKCGKTPCACPAAAPAPAIK